MKAAKRLAPEAHIAATDEILQVMYWLRGEEIAQEVIPTDLARWVEMDPAFIEVLLQQLVGSNLVERVVVERSGTDSVTRFRLTPAGLEEGGRRFADEFADLTQPGHFEHSDPACDCQQVSRFSVSLKKSLFYQLDEMIRAKGYENRSLAIADMIRDHLVEHWQEMGESDAVGTIMLAYDSRDLQVHTTLAGLQEQHLDRIVSMLRVPIDLQSCMDVLVVRGKASDLTALADRLIGAKGVKHGKLSLTATPKDLAG